MKTRKIALTLALIAGGAQAAGPLYTTDTNPPVPLKWDTSNGPIPVYTDGGGAFTYDFDGVTPFITIERATEITQFAFDQWNNVPTSTFEAQVAGTIESQTGIADVIGANADQIYFVENGYGFWVNFDTDGSILEEFFGVPRSSVLGIAFPEFSDGNGTIIEATAVINGWTVWETDFQGELVAGVFTHEFGHAINLSHSQVNGPMAYSSYTYAPKYPGVEGCGVEAVYRWDYPESSGLNRADPYEIETMYPFINSFAESGKAMSQVSLTDDIAAISNLYPTPDYHATRGSISGTLRLKDGKTEFSGINIIARNVNDLMGDAVSAISGDQTQGKIGPDGRFTINNLTPGEQYVVYMDEITAGGYPTTPQRLVSEAEYWNVNEGSDPSTDLACDATPITAEAGVSKNADLYFNGYPNGIEFRPIVAAFLTDLAKNGRSSMGVAGTTGFVWNENYGFKVLPANIKVGNPSMTRNGQKLLVLADNDGNGIQQAAIWTDSQGATPLGDLNGDTCGGSGQAGLSSSYGWALDDAGNTAVGTAYIDNDGDGNCRAATKGEIVPFVWTNKKGMQQLPFPEGASTTSYLRAQAISGNGEVILGNNGGSRAMAWVGDKAYNLHSMFGSRDVYAVNYDGTRVGLFTNEGVKLWDPINDPDNVQDIGGLKWCEDLQFIRFGTNFCDVLGPEMVQSMLGPIPVLPLDMTDDGNVIIGRAGSFFTGFVGGIWFEDIGWMNFDDFLSRQGVVEASNAPFDNPISISASGREIVGGIAGATFSWHIDLDQVFVCEDGRDIQTGFPNGLVNALKQGAEFGRCAHID
jgi:hypothetical protein